MNVPNKSYELNNYKNNKRFFIKGLEKIVKGLNKDLPGSYKFKLGIETNLKKVYSSYFRYWFLSSKYEFAKEIFISTYTYNHLVCLEDIKKDIYPLSKIFILKQNICGDYYGLFTGEQLERNITSVNFNSLVEYISDFSKDEFFSENKHKNFVFNVF